MAGNAKAVSIGVCNVSFDGNDLGYTKGFVKLSYSSEVTEKTVDQEDAPIDLIVTKQVCTCTVPLAEYDLERFALFLPGATLTKDLITDPANPKYHLKLTGSAGGSLLAKGKELIITPVGGTANDVVTFAKAVPQPKMEYSYEKENVRVYEITFTAVKDPTSGDWVDFGDTTI